MHLFPIFLALGVISVGVLVYAEWRAVRWLTVAAKSVAASLFVIAAISVGAIDTLPGCIVLAGLVLCAVGDVCLLAKARGWFLAGMAAFGSGHLAYLAAVSAVGWPPIVVFALTATAVTGGGVLVLTRLWTDLGSWRGPVAVYAAIILAMVAVTASAAIAGIVPPLMAISAAAFAVSDIAVARDRLIRPAFGLRLWGLPLYFAAQFGFAWSAGQVA